MKESEVIFRFASSDDAPQLKRLWSRSFGDPEAFVQEFLDHFGYYIGVVAEMDGLITCAAYLVPTDGIQIPGGERLSCSYIYAVAVLPEKRGNGLGRDITCAALKFSKEAGYDYAVLKPSDERLFEFYGKLGFETFTYADESVIKFKKPQENREDIVLSEISGSKYMELREEALRGFLHIVPSEKCIEYQQKLGKLYGFDFGDLRGCAAVEKYGDSVSVKELLVPYGRVRDAVSKLAAVIPAEKYKVVTPAGRRPQKNGMIYPPLKLKGRKPFLGFAFD